jgi:Holliday junction resolvase RusA-like endonuclease
MGARDRTCRDADAKAEEAALRLLGVPAVASKKNRREWIVRGGRRFLVPSASASSDETTLHLLAASAEGALIAEDDVELRIVYHARSGTVDLECESIGPRPKGFTGRKRDAHGMIETIADALQGAWFTNDNQIARLTIERRLD